MREWIIQHPWMLFITMICAISAFEKIVYSISLIFLAKYRPDLLEREDWE